MTLTRESEALLDRISSLNGRSFPLATRDDFAAIEAAVRAEQAAEMAELRRAIALTTGAFEEEVERLRAALEALDELTAYPFAFDNWGCRDCQQETGHSPGCRVGKAIAARAERGPR